MKINENIEITNEDNMILMARYPDNYFDLAVVDPPYGIGMDKNPCGRLAKYGSVSKADNNPPSQKYFNELFRVSKNQIIWGMNYFNLPLCKNFIVWDKKQPDGVTFAQAELAYTSFNVMSKMFRMSSKGQKNRIHPTQKPVKLYEWIFKNYAKPNFKILDTHLGSGNIVKALDKVNKLDKMNLSIVACEIDKEYFEASIKNIKLETSINTINF